MERIPIEGRKELHEVVSGVYNLVFADDLAPDELELYYIESEHVEAEIELPYIGLNRADWEESWTAERKLEVLLHEFAHVEEGPDEPDHGPRYYDRLAALVRTAASAEADLEAIFGTTIDFEQVHEHIVASVNEYTIEADIETVEDRRRRLRRELSAPDTAQ